MKMLFLLSTLFLTCAKKQNNVDLQKEIGRPRLPSMYDHDSIQSGSAIESIPMDSNLVFADSVFHDYVYQWSDYLQPLDTTLRTENGYLRVQIVPQILPDSFALSSGFGYKTRPFAIRVLGFLNGQYLFNTRLDRKHGEILYSSETVRKSGETALTLEKYISKYNFLLLTQGFYFPHSDVGGSMFYVIDIKGQIKQTGRVSHGRIDTSPNQEKLLTWNTIYDLNKMSRQELPRQFIASYFVTDTVVVGFDKNDSTRCGHGYLIGISNTLIDSFVFCGFNEELYTTVFADREPNTHNLVAYDHVNRAVLVFNGNLGRPLTYELSDLEQYKAAAKSTALINFGPCEFYFDANGSIVGYFQSAQ